MYSNSLWIFLLILHCAIVTPRPTQTQQYNYDAQNKPKEEIENDQVISVRITSSVAVGRSRPRPEPRPPGSFDHQEARPHLTTPPINTAGTSDNFKHNERTEVPPNLLGANIEFIKQLNAKKDTRNHQNVDLAHPFQFSKQNQFVNDPGLSTEAVNRHDATEFPEDTVAEPLFENLDREVKQFSIDEQLRKVEDRALEIIEGRILLQNSKQNETDDTVAEPSLKSELSIINDNDDDDDENVENIENVPLARSVPLSPSSKNYIQGLADKLPSERGNSPSVTTVSFNILHDTPEQSPNYNNRPSNTYSSANDEIRNRQKFYEPPKVYSQPAKIYSEPAKFYSEPAKVYSEPAKVYSEPAKIYSEPAKIYSEPAKFYSQPASLHLTPDIVPNYTPWQSPAQGTPITAPPWQSSPPSSGFTITNINTTPTTLNTMPVTDSTERVKEQQPERNYEVDEKVSVLTDGRSHGVQESTTEKCKQDNCKVGYVVEGRQYKKYRVEERTPDGFIVGEYGVVRNEDGALRGVRYTADGDASPRLIYDALMKFLQLK